MIFFHNKNIIEAKKETGFWGRELEMGYIKIRFSENFNQIGSKFGKTIQDLFRLINPTFVLSERNWEPQMDIYETPMKSLSWLKLPGSMRKI